MHIIILGGYSSAHQKLKERLACQLTLITKTSALKEKYRQRYDHILTLKEVDEDLWVALGLVMGRQYPTKCVVTFDDDYHRMAQDIAKGLDIPYLYGEKTLDLVTSKPKLRQFLYAAGYSQVESQRVQTLADISTFFATTGVKRAIVKPVHGSGSQNIYELTSASDLNFLKTLLAQDAYMIESFITGQEYSVESYSEAGEHYIYGITEKHKNEHFVEIGHVVPAPLAAKKAAQIKAYVSQVLTHLGVTDGPMHTEVMVTPTGLELVETQARVGGDMINELHSEVLGVDLLGDIMEGMVTKQKAATFKAITEKTPRYYAAIAFGMSGSGRVKTIDVPSDLKRQPGYLGYRIWRQEQEIANEENSSVGRISQAWAKAETPQEAWERAQKLLSAITITYEPMT